MALSISKIQQFRIFDYYIFLFDTNFSNIFLAPRKHWLLEEGPSDTEGGFINRHGPFQSSLNERKPKVRTKKPSLLKGIGHMFRFGKHRKDGIAPTETLNEVSRPKPIQQLNQQQQHQLNDVNMQKLALHQAHVSNDRPPGGPPIYQPPPPPIGGNGGNSAIHQNDVFNHRYSHYVNYEELQQQIRLVFPFFFYFII